MKKILIYAMIMVVVGFAVARTARLISDLRSENRTLQGNVETLMVGAEYYKTKAGESTASVQQLTLKIGDYERLRSEDAAVITALGIKIKRLEATSLTASQTDITATVPLRDTVIVRDTIREVYKTFRWQDAWTSVDGIIDNDSVAVNVQSVDTLRQMVYRVPRTYLWGLIKCGTKAIRQEVVSSNPHTQIVYTEYIKLEN